MKIYSHKTCNSCKKAIKWLAERGLDVEHVAIADTPPSIEELKQALASGYTLKALFNTSGLEYRGRDMKNLLPTMSEDEALELLSCVGMLVKRPFLVADSVALVGFKEDAWETALS